MNLIDEDLTALPLGDEDENVGVPVFLKESENHLYGVSKIGIEFEVFRYDLVAKRFVSRYRESGYSPIAFDHSDGITAVLGYYRSHSRPKTEDTRLYIFNKALELVIHKDLGVTLKSAFIKIHTIEEPASDPLQIKLAIVSGFENPPQVFKLTYVRATPEKKASWKLVESAV